MGLNMNDRGLTAAIVPRQACWICKNVGSLCTLWPQEIIARPEPVGNPWARELTEFSDGSWKVYRTSHTRALSSGNRVITVCPPHWQLLHYHWVLIAQQEVWLEDLWHAHMDRMER